MKNRMNNDTSYSSIWLFEKRKDDMLPVELTDKIATPIGRGSPTGKTNYSEFNSSLCKKIINFWSNEGDTILDPFAGRTRAGISVLNKRGYIGFELSVLAYNHIVVSYNRFKYNNPNSLLGSFKLINDDCYNIDNYYNNLNKFDMIFTCPPYWNLERYYAGKGDLSEIEDYDIFLKRYEDIFRRVVNYLKPEKYMILVVGDFRKNKKYYSFHSDNIKIFDKFKDIKLHDIIVNQSVTFDIANFRFGGFKHNKIVSKVHEYILIYKKI